MYFNFFNFSSITGVSSAGPIESFHSLCRFQTEIFCQNSDLSIAIRYVYTVVVMKEISRLVYSVTLYTRVYHA